MSKYLVFKLVVSVVVLVYVYGREFILDSKEEVFMGLTSGPLHARDLI